MQPPALRGALCLALLLGPVLAGLAGCAATPAGPAGRAASPAPAAPAAALAPPATFPASDVLRDWDRARAGAYARGDVAALRALYRPGSRAGTADVRLLRSFLDRGLRVEGMRMQLLEVRVLARSPRRLRLRVTDRLVGASAVSATARRPLPGDLASTRVLELARSSAGSWLMVEVTARARPPAGR